MIFLGKAGAVLLLVTVAVWLQSVGSAALIVC
jgi:hypothetical protein